MRKRILLIYTGGTIGMNRSENGYAPQQGFLQEILEGLTVLRNEEMPEWELLELDPLLDSSNMTVVEWNLIGSIIEKHYDRFDGFVVAIE